MDEHLQAILTMGYRIEEAVRGKALPTWIKAHKGMKKSWRRGKSLEALNVTNVRFYPTGPWGGRSHTQWVIRALKEKQKCAHELVKDPR